MTTRRHVPLIFAGAVSILAVALMVLFSASGAVGESTDGTPAADANAVADAESHPCVLPDVEFPAPIAAKSLDGHYSHQAWAARAEAREEVAEVAELVKEHFGAPDGSREALRQGLIGVGLDKVSQEVVVVTDPKVADVEEVEEEIVEETSGEAIDVRAGESCRSSKTLLAAWDVLDEKNWMSNLDSLEIGYGLNPDTSQWDVSLPPSKKAVGERLKQILGGAVNIEYEEMMLAAGSRLEDTPPYYGGAGLGSDYRPGLVCTSMATVVLPSGERGSVTAGHCYRNQDKVFSNGVRMGMAQGRTDYPNKDMVRIHPSNGATFAKKVWITPDELGSAYVAGSSNLSSGLYHCSSGAVTLRVCGLYVNSMNFSFCTKDFWGQQGCRTNLTRSVPEWPSLIPIIQNGDSGGPLYTHEYPRIHVRGMIVGGPESGARLWSAKIADIKNHLSVSALAD